MNSQEPEKIKELAERLISTLGTLVPSEKADAIVRDVATELYTVVLGIPGQIAVDPTKPQALIHGGFGPNGKKAAIRAVSYRFQPENEVWT